jgi:pimeloyl-ACP methyl ester carboxylesterase
LECARNVAQAVRGSRLVVLDDCGHFAYLERPAEMLGALVPFLRQF